MRPGAVPASWHRSRRAQWCSRSWHHSSVQTLILSLSPTRAADACCTWRWTGRRRTTTVNVPVVPSNPLCQSSVRAGTWLQVVTRRVAPRPIATPAPLGLQNCPPAAALVRHLVIPAGATAAAVAPRLGAERRLERRGDAGPPDNRGEMCSELTAAREARRRRGARLRRAPRRRPNRRRRVSAGGSPERFEASSRSRRRTSRRWPSPPRDVLGYSGEKLHLLVWLSARKRILYACGAILIVRHLRKSSSSATPPTSARSAAETRRWSRPRTALRREEHRGIATSVSAGHPAPDEGAADMHCLGLSPTGSTSPPSARTRRAHQLLAVWDVSGWPPRVQAVVPSARREDLLGARQGARVGAARPARGGRPRGRARRRGGGRRRRGREEGRRAAAASS